MRTDSHFVIQPRCAVWLTLRLFILNQSIASGNQALADSSYDPLYNAAGKALTCAPTNSFLWLTLFWLDAVKHGLEQNNANYLRLSYALGPNEAWIAMWRIRLAFQLFEKLPPDLSADAIDEFIMLVNTGQLYWQTAGMFRDVSPVIQNRIVEKLKTLNVSVSPSICENASRQRRGCHYSGCRDAGCATVEMTDEYSRRRRAGWSDSVVSSRHSFVRAMGVN